MSIAPPLRRNRRFQFHFFLCPLIKLSVIFSIRVFFLLKCERDDEKIRDGEEGAGIEVLSQCGSRADEETA